MKVELQCGDTITIPEGCMAIVKDGSVVFEREEKFKDGDILAHADYLNYPCPFIYKGTDARGLYQFYVGVNSVDEIVLPDDVDKRWGNGALRYATDEEKQLLFDKMKEQGLRWNAEEKRVEKIRWRAKKGENYYFFDAKLLVRSIDEDYSAFDNEVWDAFNYFRTKEQAEEAAKRVKETLRKYHEEIRE